VNDTLTAADNIRLLLYVYVTLYCQCISYSLHLRISINYFARESGGEVL